MQQNVFSFDSQSNRRPSTTEILILHPDRENEIAFAIGSDIQRLSQKGEETNSVPTRSGSVETAFFSLQQKGDLKKAAMSRTEQGRITAIEEFIASKIKALSDLNLWPWPAFFSQHHYNCRHPDHRQPDPDDLIQQHLKARVAEELLDPHGRGEHGTPGHMIAAVVEGNEEADAQAFVRHGIQ